jgi:hypothetical protein
MWVVLISMLTGVLSVGIYVSSQISAFVSGGIISCLTAVFAFFMRDFYIFYSRHHLLSLRGKNANNLVFCYLIAVLTLSSFSVAYINVGLIFSAFIVLQGIMRNGALGGLICGTLSACGILLYDVSLGIFTAFLPIIGYALGCLPKVKKMILSMIFVICNMSIVILIGVTPQNIRCLLALIIGTGFFIAVNFEKQIFDTVETPIEENIRKTTVQRLRFISESMKKVKKNAQSAALHLQKDRRFSKLNELQSVLYGQLEVSAELISDLEKKINGAVSYDLDIIKTATETLKKKDVKLDSLTAYYNQSGRLFIEAYTSYEYNTEELANALSAALNTELGFLETVRADDTFRLVFTGISDYGLEYHVYQKSGTREVCGDNYDIFYNGEGAAFVALSDGMGTGKRAAVESKMLLNHFKRLMKSGIGDVPLAIKMINYIMNVKSDEDMFATLDLAKIDLDTGETRLYKYGAGATLLKRDDEVAVVSDISMPVGIMEKLEPYSEHRVDLQPDDLLIILSDGVPENEYPGIKKLLLRNYTDLDILARKIGKTAAESSRDDITVIIVKIV